MKRVTGIGGVFLQIALFIVCVGSASGDDFSYKFAYTSNGAEGQTGIYLHSVDGERLLSTGFRAAEAPCWSPDGSSITFQAKVNDRWDIYVMDVNSGKSRPLTNDAFADFHPVWSPNGTTIAFYSERSTPARVWMIESDGTSLREFPIAIPGVADFAWSPDGQEVVFCATETVGQPTSVIPGPFENVNSDVYIASNDGKNLRRVTNTGLNAMSPSWSPNGRQIAFALTAEPGHLSNIHIHVVNVDGTGFARLTTDPGQNLCPKWVPDGSGLLHYNQPTSSESSTPRLRFVSVDGVRKTVIDVGKSGGYFPDISPNAGGK